MQFNKRTHSETVRTSPISIMDKSFTSMLNSFLLSVKQGTSAYLWNFFCVLLKFFTHVCVNAAYFHTKCTSKNWTFKFIERPILCTVQHVLKVLFNFWIFLISRKLLNYVIKDFTTFFYWKSLSFKFFLTPKSVNTHF